MPPAVRGLARVDVAAGLVGAVSNGRALSAWDGDGPWAVFGPDGRLLAVYERHPTGEARPAVVVPA